MALPILCILGVGASTAVTWWGRGKLEGASARLAKYYRLPAVVRGTLIMAVGSSFPELTTTVLSTLIHGEFELGMAAIVGSAIFNILVIPALAGLTGKGIAHSLRLVYRDAQFYLTSVAVLLLTFSFAIIYHPIEGEPGELSGSITRPIALIPLMLYGFYLFLQQQDVSKHRHEQQKEKKEKKEKLANIDASKGPTRDWLILVFALVAIIAGVEALVRSVLFLGNRFGIPSFLWGVTVVAAATSLPDALVSYRAAHKDQGSVSLGNVLGSNIFDLLVAVPVGILLAGATVVDYTVAAPLMGMLTLATIVLFGAMRTEVALSRGESWLLLGLYSGFIAWAIMESMGLVNFVGGA